MSDFPVKPPFPVASRFLWNTQRQYGTEEFVAMHEEKSRTALARKASGWMLNEGRALPVHHFAFEQDMR